jgi:hypothetical protein
MASGPLAANGVVSVAVVPDCTPFAYNVSFPVDASKVPARLVHVPACAAEADSATSQFGDERPPQVMSWSGIHQESGKWCDFSG